MKSLAHAMETAGFDGYAYSYPHKSSYRELSPPVDLIPLWQEEDCSSLFLYVHLPFCEMRCGFCNLFTEVNPAGDSLERTLRSIQLESDAMASALAPATVSKMAFGGGTPSFLDIYELGRLFEGLTRSWGMDWQSIPSSFEVSPATISPEKLAFLKEQGIQRVSMGVQSFFREDLKALGRVYREGELERACKLLVESGIPLVNLDLIYGAEHQTEERWLRCIDRALEWTPGEIYLYPLYVRALTGLGRTGKEASEHRMALYRVGRDRLLASGYEQISMRLFRRAAVNRGLEEGLRETDYCCQEDGMVGLGAGARSYTRELHYSSPFAVGQSSIREIVEGYQSKKEAEHLQATHGVWLNQDEQRRRYIIKSLLRREGLCLRTYREKFRSGPLQDYPELVQLEQLGLADSGEAFLRLNGEGMGWSDTIGPWLYSDAVCATMEEAEVV